MKTLVTVTCDQESVRISKVTAHGEEVIEADIHAKLLAMMLWRQLGISSPGIGEPLFPSLTVLTTIMQELSVHLKDVVRALDKHTRRLEEPPPPAPDFKRGRR